MMNKPLHVAPEFARRRSAALLLLFPTNFCAEPSAVQLYTGTRKSRSDMTNIPISGGNLSEDSPLRRPLKMKKRAV